MKTLLLLLLGAYAALCLLVFVFQRKFIYFPRRWGQEEEQRANPGYEEVRMRTADGERLHAWLHRSAGSPWTVIVFHGNAGNLWFHEPSMKPFKTLGLQVLLFDYRGYGLSTGEPSQEGLLRDGEAAVDYAEKVLRIPRERLVYFGQSLGTGVATGVAVQRPPGRLILQSAYDSLPHVARAHYPFLPAGLLLRERFDSGDAMQRIHCPVLLVHPAEDEIIPAALGRALFERAHEPKRFVLIPGARHNDLPDSFPPLYLRILREFLMTAR